MSSFALQEELSERPNADSMGRDGLRRSIALALEHVGFDAATPEALESFANNAETCTCHHGMEPRYGPSSTNATCIRLDEFYCGS